LTDKLARGWRRNLPVPIGNPRTGTESDDQMARGEILKLLRQRTGMRTMEKQFHASGPAATPASARGTRSKKQKEV